ncbi:MAG: hypothetical protein AB7F86_13345 [Bdellovibrionales bacterium]
MRSWLVITGTLILSTQAMGESLSPGGFFLPGYGSSPVQRARVDVAPPGPPVKILNPDAGRPTDHPAKVIVDQSKQEACFITPEGRECTKVSTGGTVKVTEYGVKCGKTDPRDRVFVPAVKDKEVRDQYDAQFRAERRNLDDDQIQELMSRKSYLESREDYVRKHATMFEVWKSRTYKDDNGVEIPLRKAIKIGFGERGQVADGTDWNGEFFHCVPGGPENNPTKYSSKLGQAVSGGCVRLPSSMCRKLFGIMEKYKGLEISIQGNRPECDPQLLAETRARWDAGEFKRHQTGSEGTFGDSDFFTGFFKSIFGGFSQGNRPKAGVAPAEPQPKQAGAPQRRRSDREWTKSVFDNTGG